MISQENYTPEIGSSQGAVHLSVQGMGAWERASKRLPSRGSSRRNLNVQPTIRVPTGYKFTVRVNRDILFETPYESIEPARLQS